MQRVGLYSRLHVRRSRRRNVQRLGPRASREAPTIRPDPPEPRRQRVGVSTPLPEGRLKKRLRAAWRWRQMAGLLSLLWPFFQRFNLAETPEGNFPERPMATMPGTELKAPATRDRETRAEPTWISRRLHFRFLWRNFRIRVCFYGKIVNIRFYISSVLGVPERRG